jgi:hypothetical protein
MREYAASIYGKATGAYQAVKEKMNTKMGKVGTIASGGIMATALSATPTFAAVPVDFTGVTVGFTPSDLLTGATGFYSLFIGFIVLVLAIKLAPSLIGFLFNIIGKLRSSKS